MSHNNIRRVAIPLRPNHLTISPTPTTGIVHYPHNRHSPLPPTTSLQAHWAWTHTIPPKNGRFGAAPPPNGLHGGQSKPDGGDFNGEERENGGGEATPTSSERGLLATKAGVEESMGDWGRPNGVSLGGQGSIDSMNVSFLVMGSFLAWD
ncbi:hypothetical protein Acr_02g0013840 [Actinidia rufa]|uniref:Uncharacterized protein n=1 Tax=Actinidia rufa TaxID=165716 RepID=A0A7J0E9H8_9ERIC|nr:hypothetical protein Acr_02g0013840 [Actinidia rufa]